MYIDGSLEYSRSDIELAIQEILEWEPGSKIHKQSQTYLGSFFYSRYSETKRKWHGKKRNLGLMDAELGDEHDYYNSEFLYEIPNPIDPKYFETARKLYEMFYNTKRFSYGLSILGFILRNSNPEASFIYFYDLTKTGHVDALYNIGFCLLNGQGIYQDFIHGLKCISTAAQLGYTPAYYHLGNLVALQKVQAGNTSLSLKFWKNSASIGCYESYYFIGLSYFNGLGMSVNYVEALRCFLVASECGHAFASFWAGYCYKYGLGTLMNEKKALEYFTLTVRQSRHLENELSLQLFTKLQEEEFYTGFIDDEEFGDQ